MIHMAELSTVYLALLAVPFGMLFSRNKPARSFATMSVTAGKQRQSDEH